MRKWKDNIKTGFKGIGCEYVDWIHVTLDTECVPGALTPWIKRLGLEADHSHTSSSAEIMSEWSYTSTHPLSTHGMEIN
jgi:hypothetical protein